MFWQNSFSRGHLYHPESKSDPGCRTFLRQKNLEKSAMQSSWNFPR